MSFAPCLGSMGEETERQRCASAVPLLKWLPSPYNTTRWAVVPLGVCPLAPLTWPTVVG